MQILGYFRRILPRMALLSATGWIAAQQGVQQLLRLGTNVLLARLLAPELLGMMLLINTLRTGGELLSDVGIGQSIVSDPRGREPWFYNTAWTIQMIRGVLLFVAALAAAGPLARLYDDPQLALLLPIAAVVFVLSGFSSPSRFLLQKDMHVRRVAIFGMMVALTSSIIHVCLALYTPTIWALIWGLLLSTLFGTVVSYFLIDWRIHAIRLNKDAIRSIIKFGRWLFLASLIYFAAMNFDRLYLAEAVPFALLGVYGIARTLADAILELFVRVSQLIIFPKFAAARSAVTELRERMIPLRRLALIMMALGLAAVVALADQFVYLVYDVRYQAASIFLPILLIGTWFAILASAGEAMMMGIGKSSGVAASNAAKFLFILITVPILLPTAGIVATSAAVACGDAARYVVLVWRKRAYGISFIRQDLAATAFFFLLIVIFREMGNLIGLTGGVLSWLAEAREAVG